MATPPFNIAQTSPAPTDLVSSFPADEQSNRDIIESWLTLLSDPATGLLRSSAITLPLTLTQAAAGTILTLVSTDAGLNTGPTLVLYRNSASPAAADNLGQVQWNFKDSTGAETTAAAIVPLLDDPVNGSEDASLRMFNMTAGALTQRFTLNATGADLLGEMVVDTLLVGVNDQSDALLRVRDPGNSIEFGHPNPAGYGSTLGAYNGAGYPFLAFNAEAGTTSNTFLTRGFRGAIMRSDNAGGWVFENVATASADNQTATTRAQLTNTGVLLLSGGAAATPIISNLDDTNTGIYWSSADVLTFTTGGVARGSFANTSFTLNIPIISSAGATVTTLSATTGTFSGTVTAPLFSGSGASLTALNASNLSSGTVPSARVAGSYTGITGTGALAAGSITSGFGSINVGTDDISAGQFLAGAGVGAYSFTADTNTGMDNFAADNIGLNAGGIRRLTVNSTGIVINGAVDASGTVSGGTVESTAVFQVQSAATLTLRPNPGSATGQMTLATDGDIVGQGTFTGDDFIIPSDKRLKKDITALSKSPHYIEPVEYTLKKTNERHVGFLADDFVGLPGAAIRDDNGILQLAPMAILAYLWDRVNRLEANL